MLGGMTKKVFPVLNYDDPDRALDWLSEAFGFVPGLVARDDDGAITHAEVLTDEDGIVFISGKTGPASAQVVYVSVDDAVPIHDRAVAAGAQLVNPLHHTDYGSHEFCCADPAGHLWTFGTYEPTP
jgi:uncharacterized glyoxalase superfamily protein PhnB